MATELYSGGILIEEDYMHHEAAIQSTLDAMKDLNIGAIFEAAYMEDRVRIRADILERLPSGRWNLIEVKSSTKLKKEYLADVAVQYRVLQRAGLDLDRICLMHINRAYVLDDGGLDLARFLIREDLTEDAIWIQDFVLEHLNDLKNRLSKGIAPDIQPSRHFTDPFHSKMYCRPSCRK